MNFSNLGLVLLQVEEPFGAAMLNGLLAIFVTRKRNSNDRAAKWIVLFRSECQPMSTLLPVLESLFLKF